MKFGKFEISIEALCVIGMIVIVIVSLLNIKGG